jgi:hypothetical protein
MVESGCKVVICQRMKGSGMHWSRSNAENMLALRCRVLNGEKVSIS